MVSRYPPSGSGSGGSLYWGDSVATHGSLPASGVAVGEIRLVRDTSRFYKWDGAAWVLLIDPTSYSSSAALAAHTGDTGNPHSTTKAQVGLGNVDNTADSAKPVSTAQAAADSAVQAFAIQRSNHTGTQAAGTISGLAAVATSGLKSDVGLGNVDNTSDANKPVSTAQAAADAATLSSANTYTDSAVAAIVDSSPTTLNTLNELADALGDDPNFATTTATALGNRLRVDTAAQGLSAGQKTNAKTNIDLQNVDNTSDATKWAATAVVTNKDYDGGTASNASRLTLAKAALSTLLGLARKAGNMFFSTDLLKTLIDDGTVLRPLPEGEKNYCVLPSYYQAAASANDLGWFVSGGTVSNVTTGLPRGVTTRSAIQFVSTTTGDYLRYRFQIDDIDATRRLKIAFAQIVAVFGDYKLEVYSGTDAALSSPTLITVQSIYTNSSGITTLPVGTIDVSSSAFDATSRLYYEVRWTALGSSKTIKVSDVVIGSGVNQPTGVPPSEWENYTPGLTNGGTTSTNNARFRRVGGPVIEIETYAVFTGAGAASPFKVGLPAGYTAAALAPGAGVGTVGTASFYNGSAFTVMQTYVSGNTIGFIANGGTNDFLGSSLANGHHFGIRVFVTVSELVGRSSSAVNPISQSPIRAGIVQAFAGATTPAGWLDCDGSTYLQSQYPQLFAALGSTWATCTNPLTGSAYSAPAAGLFRVPDLRGAFLRGVGAANAAGVATTLAGYQADTTAKNGLTVTPVANQIMNNSYTDPSLQNATKGAGAGWNLANGYSSAGLTVAGDAETRPDNVGVKYIIKAWDESFNLAGFAAAASDRMGMVAPRKGQYALTVTCAQAGWTTQRAVGIYYQDQDGNHRLKFNIHGTYTSATVTGLGVNITGVTFKSTYPQACSGFLSASTLGSFLQAYVSNPNTVSIIHASSSGATSFYASGDVELESKPTWA